MFKQAQSFPLFSSLPLTQCLPLKKLGKMGLLLTCLQEVGGSWVLSKYKAAKSGVLDPHPEQIITDLQKGFPGSLLERSLSGTSCGLSDVHTPKPTIIFVTDSDCGSASLSMLCLFYFFPLRNINDLPWLSLVGYSVGSIKVVGNSSSGSCYLSLQEFWRIKQETSLSSYCLYKRDFPV